MRSAILCIVLVSFSFLSSALVATTEPPPTATPTTTAAQTTTAAPTRTANHTGTTSTATTSTVAAAAPTVSSASQSGSTAASTKNTTTPGATNTPSIAPTTTAPTAIQCYNGTCDGKGCLENDTIAASIPKCNKPEPGDCMVSTMTNATHTQMMSECITECTSQEINPPKKVVQCCQTSLCTEDTTKAPSRAASPSVTSTAFLLITIVLYHCLIIVI